MSFNLQQALKAFILLMFSGLIIKFHLTGEIGKLINQDYNLLSKIAAAIFLFLFIMQLPRIWTKEHHHDHDHECNHSCDHTHVDDQKPFVKIISYIIIVFPLVTGFAIPPKVLDASIAEKKGVFLNKANVVEQQDKPLENSNDDTSEPSLSSSDQNSNPTDQTNGTEEVHELPVQEQIDPEKVLVPMIEEILKEPVIQMKAGNFVIYGDTIHYDPEKFSGKEITLKGFVYKEEGMTESQLVISRFVITHCVADASIIGFLSEFKGAKDVKEDTWIEATGIIDVFDYGSLKLPRINVTEWKIVDEPTEPYVYP